MSPKTPKSITYFYGTVTGMRLEGSTVTLSTKDGRLLVRANDHGLDSVRIGKRRLVIVEDGSIVAVYIRPRRKFFLKFGAGELITYKFLLSLKPKYFIG
jgi:hypothetical protein